MSADTLSRRLGFGGQAVDITIRNDAPYEVRAAILKIADGELELGPGTIRDVLCTVLRKVPDANNWSSYPNIWNECQQLMDGAP